MESKSLLCDYLVIGSGASTLAFIDTLLTEMPNTKVIVVDRKARPGGHWVDDYDFVKLHQPSVVYGLASQQLEGNWLKLMFLKRMLPWKHRASKNELLDYFGNFINKKVKSGHVQYFPECTYDFDKIRKSSDDDHKFTSLDGKHIYTVKVREKLVNGVLGECKIPILCPPKFEVHNGVNIIPPNALYNMKKINIDTKHFVVLGCGKTAMDTIVFLQTELKINPEMISWVIPNDVWMNIRDGPWEYMRVLLECDGDEDKAATTMEKKGCFVRLDKNITPNRFRFPVIRKDELELMQKIKNTIRRGRVSSIRPTDDESITVSFENGREDWVLSTSPSKEPIFVHCTSPGPFNGATLPDEIFNFDQIINLELLYAPPISISMSCIAMLECARKMGTLDVNFGRELLQAGTIEVDKNASGNEVLCHLIRGFDLNIDGVEVDFIDKLRPAINLAMFLALVHSDPIVGYEWMKANRLSFFGIPGFKGGVVESLCLFMEKKDILKVPESYLNIIQKLAEKLEPLKGK